MTDIPDFQKIGLGGGFEHAGTIGQKILAAVQEKMQALPAPAPKKTGAKSGSGKTAPMGAPAQSSVFAPGPGGFMQPMAKGGTIPPVAKPLVFNPDGDPFEDDGLKITVSNNLHNHCVTVDVAVPKMTLSANVPQQLLEGHFDVGHALMQEAKKAILQLFEQEIHKAMLTAFVNQAKKPG